MTIVFSDISTSPPPFLLTPGGQYGVTACAVSWGSASLQIQAPDETTWIAAAAPITGDGVTLLTLPAGEYRLVLTGVSGLYLSLSAILPPA